MFKKRDDCTSITEVIERNTQVSIDDLLSNHEAPFLHGLKEASEFIRQHSVFNVVSDYDVDGVMSTLIMALVLQKLGKKFYLIIPRRFSDGYGISRNILKRIKEGAIITVDNGIAAAEVISEANESHDVFVVDHHLKRDDGILPDCGILDPHVEEESDFKYYCGAGLAYRIAKELLNDKETLEICCIFASIATVADVVPLVGDNYQIVREGLSLINEGKGTLGLRALLQALNIEHVQESDYGFHIGPVINASGRLFDDGPMDVCKVLYYNKKNPSAKEINTLMGQIEVLIQRNEDRKKIEKEEYKFIEPIHDPERVIVAYKAGLHEGILGNLASKLVEKYHVPAIVLTDTKSGLLKGSGRSTPNVHMKDVLDATSKYLVKYGGHAGAAGLSLEKKDLKGFRMALSKRIPKKEKQTDTFYDLEISLKEIPKIAIQLNQYRPFGEGNPEPVFYVKDIKTDILKKGTYVSMGPEKQHVKIKSNDINFLMFNMKERFRKDGYPICISAIGTISTNYFMGQENPQMEVLDYEKVKLYEETDMFRFLKGTLDFTGKKSTNS